MAHRDHDAGCWMCEEMRAREQAALAAAEDATRSADETMLRFAHELRGRLNAITGWTEVLRGQLESLDEVGERALSTIERNAWAQARVIEDMLESVRARAEARVAGEAAAEHRDDAAATVRRTTGSRRTGSASRGERRAGARPS